MKLAKNIILSLSVAFFIIGVHQTITLGFEVSYWIFMLTISMFLLYTLVGRAEKDPSRKKKKEASRKGKKKGEAAMNRQAKRHMERMK
jgi:uncharacterized ion transporter superfamily protein YfcC